jgi:hypothetical protein
MQPPANAQIANKNRILRLPMLTNIPRLENGGQDCIVLVEFVRTEKLWVR